VPDLAASLAALKHSLQTASDFMVPWHQFHDEVAMPSVMTSIGTPATHPRLERCLAAIAERLFKRPGAVEDPHFFHVAEHRFWHGSCFIGGRVAIGFYFDDDEIGLVGYMQSAVSSRVELVRLRQLEVPAGAFRGVAGSERRN